MKKLFASILVLIMMSVLAYAVAASEPVLVAQASNCSAVSVKVTGQQPIQQGEYYLVNCTETISNLWDCPCNSTHESDVWLYTQDNNLNQYNFSVIYYPYLDTPTPDVHTISAPLMSCDAWSDCVDNISTRSCYSGNRAHNFTETRRCTISQLCIEDWQCSAWEPCIGGMQARTCEDAAGCATELKKPASSQACNSSCVEDWQCSDWGSCVNHTKSRTCYDMHECGTNSSMPDLTASCSSGSGGGDGGSTAASSSVTAADSTRGWICEPWSDCVDGEKSTICYRDSISTGMNFTEKEKCVVRVADAPAAPVEDNSTIIIQNPSNEDLNGTVDKDTKGHGNLATGLFGLLLPKEPLTWVLLGLGALVILGLASYQIMKGNGLAEVPTGKRRA